MSDHISDDAAEELRRLGEQVALEVLERAEANLAPEDEARSVAKEDVLTAWSEMMPGPGLIMRFVAGTLSLAAIIFIAFELAAKYLPAAAAALMIALVGILFVLTRFDMPRIPSVRLRLVPRHRHQLRSLDRPISSLPPGARSKVAFSHDLSLSHVMKLPSRNLTFTGREQQLEELRHRLSTEPVAKLIITGIGGVGKSALALEYAHRARASGRYEVIGWVRASSPVTMAEDLAVLAPSLGVPSQGPTGVAAAEVVATLASRQDWLVVFDNAQNPDDLAGMLPGGAGHVLITSRNPVWSGIAAQVDLRKFSRSESVKFVRQRSRSDELADAGELADELVDLPLALEQAAAYIDTRSMTIRGYLGSYRDPMLTGRSHDVGPPLAEYPVSVARTWLLSFRQLSYDHPAAAELLRLSAFLDPDDIDLDLLSAGRAEVGDVLARALGDRQERAKTVDALAATSLVTVPAEGHLRVHRLVQAVTRDQLNYDETAMWTDRALNMVGAILPSAPADFRSWPMYDRLAPHIEAVTGHSSSLSLLTKKVELLKKLGMYLATSVQLVAARTIFERVLTMLEAAYGPDDPEVAKALDNLAAVQAQLGELRDARAKMKRALAVLQEAYGSDDPEVARVLGNLSIVETELWEELKDARASSEHTQTIFQAVYGPDHPEVAKSFIEMGIVQLRMGELREARASLERGLAISDATDRPDRPEAARALIGLGGVQMRQGELKKARASLERALVISEEVYGHDHPGVAPALIALGAVKMRQGELKDARADLDRALAALRAAYGPDHPEVASALVYLGGVQLRQGELRNAHASIEHALVVREAVYGPDHPQVASALINLGIVQLQQGELASALLNLERALGISESAFGFDHPEVASALVYLGAAQLQRGELSNARASLERALAISEAVYGPDHPEAAKALVGLSTLQLRLRKPRVARATLKRAVAISETTYGPSHLKVARILISLGVTRRREIAKYLTSIFLRLDEHQG
jgi:Tfp pilus assembly protein PilF